MHRLAQRVVAAEGEAQVRDAAARARARAALLDRSAAPRGSSSRSSSCSSIPVATASTLGSKMMSSGAKPTLLGEQVVGAAADRDAPLDVGRLALLVERHHDDARRRSRGSAAPARGTAASPSLRLIELTIPFPWMRLRARPRAPTSASCRPSSAAARPRARSRSRSGRCASPARSRAGRRPCSRRACSRRRAPARARPRPRRRSRSPSTSRRKRAEPVTFVRSPISTKPVSGPISNGSRPLQAVRARRRRAGCEGRGRATRRGDRARVRRRRAAAAAGDVQEPGLGELAQERARHLGRLVVAAERVRQPGVRVGADEAGRDPRELGDVGPHLAARRASS